MWNPVLPGALTASGDITVKGGLCRDCGSCPGPYAESSGNSTAVQALHGSWDADE